MAVSFKAFEFLIWDQILHLEMGSLRRFEYILKALLKKSNFNCSFVEKILNCRKYPIDDKNVYF